MPSSNSFLNGITADAAKAAGLAALLNEELVDEELLDEEDAVSLRRVRKQILLWQGLLWRASRLLVAELFSDLSEIETAPDDVEWYWRDSMALRGLPARFADQYDADFVRRFIASTVVVTARFATTWLAPATVAEELAITLLLNRAESLVKQHGIRTDADWRDNLESVFFEDDDHQLLYDNPEELTNQILWDASSVPMGFEHWFTPFRDPPETAPYAVSD